MIGVACKRLEAGTLLDHQRNTHLCSKRREAGAVLDRRRNIHLCSKRPEAGTVLDRRGNTHLGSPIPMGTTVNKAAINTIRSSKPSSGFNPRSTLIRLRWRSSMPPMASPHKYVLSIGLF